MSKKEKKIISEEIKVNEDNWDSIANDVINKELELENFLLHLRFATCSFETKEQIKKEIRKRMYNE